MSDPGSLIIALFIRASVVTCMCVFVGIQKLGLYISYNITVVFVINTLNSTLCLLFKKVIKIIKKRYIKGNIHIGQIRFADILN